MESGCVQRPNVVTQFFVCFQCVCVCERELGSVYLGEREKCVCLCVREREREKKNLSLRLREVCVTVCQRETEWYSHFCVY